MRVLTWMSSLVLALACGAALPSAQTPAGGRGAPNSLFLAPKAASPAGWVAPNKPWTKLSELLAKHAHEDDDDDDDGGRARRPRLPSPPASVSG